MHRRSSGSSWRACLSAHARAPKRIVLDLDATDDPLHGHQEGRYFHGYYGSYCYLPLYVFCGDHLLVAKLRTADRDGADGAVGELERVVAQIRERWPEVEILIRADSGLARNARLERAIDRAMHEVQAEQAKTQVAARRFEELRYQTQATWSRERRVVAKASFLPGKANPRFVVTSLGVEHFAAQALYEQIYCARGDMENRIKEQQLDLYADRTSTATLRANQLRLWFASMAYVLIAELRRVGLHGTAWARAQAGTIRLRLFKLATQVRISARRIVLSFPSAYPLQVVFAEVLARLRAGPISV
jgi:hypothetical protein